jgi:alanine racemase
MLPSDRAWAKIDLDAIRHNLHICRQMSPSQELWPILKANAYGHGAIECAKICEEFGIEGIGVGDSKEALELRNAKIKTPLLILGTAIDSEIPLLLQHNVAVGIHSEIRVHDLNRICDSFQKPLDVHLNIDTGMGRLGVLPKALPRIAKALRGSPNLNLKGVMSHIANTSNPKDEFTNYQKELFKNSIKTLRRLLPEVNFKSHMSNSMDFLSTESSIGDAVRPGIAIFGLTPNAKKHNLKPALSLYTQIAFFKDVPELHPIGYDSTFITSRPSRIATLPIGYNDGIPYNLGESGNGEVLVRGKRCPIVGKISMDYCCIDITKVNGASIGDVVTIIGQDTNEKISALELAKKSHTISYEICCSIGSRVKRHYTSSKKRSYQYEKTV